MFVSLEKFVGAVREILPGCTVYLTGSAAMDDYREGWSDLDLLILTPDGLAEDAAEALLNLRQRMTEAEPGNSFYRKIEGGAVPADAFFCGRRERAVYWGTRGERIADGYAADVFTLAAKDRWILLCGTDLRDGVTEPTPEMLYAAVKRHARTIREHGIGTENPMHRCGWLLDTARCLYTLKTGRIIPKTRAGETALRLGWCPEPEALRDALAVRMDPMTQRRDIPDSAILSFLAVLEEELCRPMAADPCFCGHDCGRCLVRLKDSRAAVFYREEMGIVLKPEDLCCDGGRRGNVMPLCQQCPMRICCREKGLSFCIDCEEPCRTYLDYAKAYVNRMGQQFTDPA